MKKLLLVTMLFTISFYAQKANLDRKYIKASYLKLPSEPILDDTKRTYTVNSNNIKIEGFSRLEEKASLEIEIMFESTKISDVEIKTIKREKKNKEGKVTSTTYSYQATSSISTSGSLSVKNYISNKNLNRSLSKNERYTSKEFSSNYKAREYWHDNKYSIRSDYSSRQRKEMLSQANHVLNNKYGYPEFVQNALFWFLGSKKHPEYQNHKDMLVKLQAVIAKMSYKTPLTDEIKQGMQEIIKYFESVVPKYPGDKKKFRKIRYSSYYNIAKIYYLLDDTVKSKEYGQKIIDNDYDKKDGKSMIKKAESLEKSFEINKVNTRHFDVLTE